jgi:ubiquinone/menaquinone biosynthesis C-methylase UbiE
VIEEIYISDEEYRDYYVKLDNLRSRIAQDLPLVSHMSILDLATGYAYFAIEVAKLESSVVITGSDISVQGVFKAQKNIEQCGLADRINLVAMDATRMAFLENGFDMVVNFTGLEDIHMTRGKEGVLKTFLEVNRVLKPDAYFCLVVMPVDEMETQAQKIEVALYSYICNATWLTRQEYITMLERAGFDLIQEKQYRTGKKLTSEQACSEIRYACENVPEIYGISTPSFEDIWGKFGKDIDENGVGHMSKVLLMIAHKCDRILP